MKNYLIYSCFSLLFACHSTGKADAVESQSVEEDQERSTIVCPFCHYAKLEVLPTESCLIRYECDSCKRIIVPKEDDCCVFCSYGDHKCPSKQ